MKNLINKNLEDRDVVEFINDYHLEQSKSSYAISLRNTDNTIGFSIDKETNTIDTVYFEKGKGDFSERLLNTTLLFDIRFKDNIETVVSKIGTEPTLVNQNKGKNVVGNKVYHHTYFVDEIAVRMWFNEDKEVISFSYSAIDDFYKAHFEWKNSLVSQSLNREIDIEKLKQQSPVETWKERLRENELLKQQASKDYIEDYWYTQKRLQQVEEIIDEYLRHLKKYCSENQPIEIEKALQNVVVKLNEFNQKTYMIETDERENLCPFFDKTIIATGIQLPQGFDPTLVYRDW